MFVPVPEMLIIRSLVLSFTLVLNRLHQEMRKWIAAYSDPQRQNKSGQLDCRLAVRNNGTAVTFLEPLRQWQTLRGPFVLLLPMDMLSEQYLTSSINLRNSKREGIEGKLIRIYKRVLFRIRECPNHFNKRGFLAF